MKISEVIAKVVENPITVGMSKRYKNSVAISGWVLRKPKFQTFDSNGIESCSLILYQMENTTDYLKMQSYSIMIYDPTLVQELKNIKSVVFLAGVGKLCFSKKIKSLYCHLEEAKIVYELDIPLAEEWRRKDD